MRFLGHIDAKTDAKGRVFLPSQFRRELQEAGCGDLVLRKDVFQRCLVLYPTAVWDDLLATMRQRLNRWNPQEQTVFRQFVADAESVTLDAQGRLLIPRRLLDYANISGAAAFIGMGDTMELWPAATAQQPFMEAEAFGEALAGLMAKQP